GSPLTRIPLRRKIRVRPRCRHGRPQRPPRDAESASRTPARCEAAYTAPAPGPERIPVTSTDTTSTPAQGASLSAMRLNDLKSLAQQMGLKGLSGKRKGDLVAMIEGARGGRPAPAREPAPNTAPAPETEPPV